MIVDLEVSGGFAAMPGLVQSHRIDTAALDPARADEVESLVQTADFFRLPSRIDTAARGAADYFTYTIRVEGARGDHTVVMTDPVMDPALSRLIEILRTSSPAP